MGQEGRCAPRKLDEAEARGRVQRRPALVVAHVHVGAELLDQQARELLRALSVLDAQLRANTRAAGCSLLTARKRPQAQPEAQAGCETSFSLETKPDEAISKNKIKSGCEFADRWLLIR